MALNTMRIAIFGMDILKAYEAKNYLETELVCLKASTVINTLLEDSADRITVQLNKEALYWNGT